jgi:ribonuclease HI
MMLRGKAGLLRWFRNPERVAGTYIANIDGASRGNPGRAAYGVVLHRPDGELLAELAKYIGHATNNVAEYYALIVALDAAVEHKLRSLRVRSDSELLVRQMQGRYKVKSPDLRSLHDRAVKLARALESFAIEHVPREQNARADQLANEVLDSTRGTVSRAAHLPARTIRARYRNGVLVPEVRLDLPDGQEVEITLRPRHPR